MGNKHHTSKQKSFKAEDRGMLGLLAFLSQSTTKDLRNRMGLEEPRNELVWFKFLEVLQQAANFGLMEGSFKSSVRTLNVLFTAARRSQKL